MISCVQSQLITCKQRKCRLSAFLSSRAVSVGRSPSSATCQCPSVPRASAHQCHINATYQCPSELPFNVTHQCQSVPPISAANQCHLSVPVSAAYQCQSV
ncbi:unnamed protein product, partial [Staurois parvus]